MRNENVDIIRIVRLLNMKKINFILALIIVSSLSLIANTTTICAIDNDINSCSMAGVMNGYNGSYGITTIIITWTMTILFMVLMVSAIYWFIKSINNKDNKSRR